MGNQMFTQTFSWVCLEAVLDRLTFESVDGVKQIALLNVMGLIQSGEDLKRTERLALPRVRVNSPCLTAGSWDISLFLPLDSN